MLSNENDTTKTWALKMYILCTYLKRLGVLVVKNCPPACIIFYFVCFSVLRYTITIRTLDFAVYYLFIFKEIILLHIQELKTKSIIENAS